MLERLATYLDWWNGLDRNDRDLFLRQLTAKRIDPAKKAEIKALAEAFIHKGISWSCGSCILDAHILLTKLKPEEMEEKTQEYALYPGTVLHDPINKDFGLTLMPPNLTESLALYHLTFNPRATKYFSKRPDDVEARIVDYLSGLDDEMKAKALPAAREALERAEAKAKAAAKSPKKTAAPADDASAEQGEA